MTDSTLFDLQLTSRMVSLRRSAESSSAYRDPAPESWPAAPHLTPVGRNADHVRIYVDQDGVVWEGHWGVDRPMTFERSSHQYSDLEEALEWARRRREHDATHPKAGRTDAGEDAS